MSTAKEMYSEVSKYYCEIKTRQSESVKRLYEKSKERERKYNENWKKEKVNLIEIVEKYAPNATAYENGVKFYFEGTENIVITDMASGYLRIFNKATGLHYRLDGTLSDSNEGTHFKIKRLEEM